ncbi:MAG: carboxynorspermidine decarboxylase [Alphaproteobacteria bacterium]|jgi:carboxynorspermidine decarboxylase
MTIPGFNHTSIPSLNRKGMKGLKTPAFVYDEGLLRADSARVADWARASGCRVLYSPKANSLHDILGIIAENVDGFAASSLFEARLINQIARDGQTVHLTNPGLRPDEIDAVAAACDYVSLNSLSQWSMYSASLAGQVNCGLRVNPEMPLVRDLRYDPCRENSKLGVPLQHLEEYQNSVPERLTGISGIHFHTNSEASDFSGLLATVRHLMDRLGPLFTKIEWINLGGGYLFDTEENMDEFQETVNLLRSRFGLEIFVEPGTAIVRRSGFLVASVVDVFVSGNKSVAVLDTTVNHWPEVFEFAFEPDVQGDKEDGIYEYILAGATCLAGDLFGTYAFNESLDVGSKVVFPNAGAYSLVKAHFFNGVNLPSVYALTGEGKFMLRKQFTFEDFARQCGTVEYENN